VSTAFRTDPDATLDWVFDWSAWLADSETITAHTITTTGTVVVDSSSVSAGDVTVWLSGASGSRVEVTCQIVTSQGRTDDRTLTLLVGDR
jgi:hypothetical protein